MTKAYGDRIVFANLGRRFAGGRMTAVVGRSGTGKTTLLHLLAGLALAADVDLLLVDEPSARLDEANGRITGALLARAARERGIAVVCATHDRVLVGLADDVLELDRENRIPGASAG